ncbi:MAG TPA: hypothetical protein VKA82_22715 [Rubrobacter sp.]|jgi:hypothetical protein|nr:hypothetical protein [Rubrobacter sp.]HKH59007.1 hypothetical protein [Rubrobacter sp.]
MIGARTFHDSIQTEAELWGIMGTPNELAVGKQLDRLDRHCPRGPGPDDATWARGRGSVL